MSRGVLLLITAFFSLMPIFSLASTNKKEVGEELFQRGYSLFLKKDFKTSFNLFLEACKKGNGRGCVAVGIMYEEGLGVSRDYKQALNFFSKACKMEVAAGCYNLGTMYYHGKGIPIDHRKALELFTKSCDLEYADACNDLGLIYAKGQGVNINYTKAIALFKKACDLGSFSGCNNLGVMYENGISVHKDVKKAWELYSKACEKNVALGCANLASLYYRGIYVEKNVERALDLWKKACKLGNQEACTQVEKVKREMEKVPSPFGLTVGVTREEEFKEIVKNKGWKIAKSGYRVIKNDIVNPNVTGYKIVDLPLEKLKSAYFWFFKGKLMKIDYRLRESMDKSTFYMYYDLLKNKYGNPLSYTPPKLKDGKALWKVGGIEIELYSPWVTTITYLSYTDPNLYSQAAESDKAIYEEQTRKKAKSLEGI